MVSEQHHHKLWLLGLENYNTWKRSILIALSAKNKLKLVNEDYEEPDSSSDLRAYWERANDILISWILNTVFKQIEGHSKEECFKLLGYPVGHPLHKKYLPPSQRTQSNNSPRIVNMVTGETSNSGDPIPSQSTPLESTPQSAPNEALVYARMDDLQNQLNQVLMMMQTNQSDIPGTSMPHVA
ncbi:cysteine-rich receptor-like protein kinase 8, partial [Tanacetum coccineum]